VFHFTSNNVKRERDAQTNRIRRHTRHPVYFIGCDDGEGRYRVRAVLPARGARRKKGGESEKEKQPTLPLRQPLSREWAIEERRNFPVARLIEHKIAIWSARGPRSQPLHRLTFTLICGAD